MFCSACAVCLTKVCFVFFCQIISVSVIGLFLLNLLFSLCVSHKQKSLDVCEMYMINNISDDVVEQNKDINIMNHYENINLD